jgi:hypothetical protein
MKTFVSMALAATVLVPSVAAAHHSFSMFDQSREVKLSGVVREFQFTNPHIWIQVVTPGRDGGPPVEWSIEGLSVNTATRLGWRRSSIKAGDEVTVIINPLKSGQRGGALKSITLPDGKVLGRN